MFLQSIEKSFFGRRRKFHSTLSGVVHACVWVCCTVLSVLQTVFSSFETGISVANHHNAVVLKFSDVFFLASNILNIFAYKQNAIRLNQSDLVWNTGSADDSVENSRFFHI